MIAGTITELYDTLGIRRSLSRPRVSNDNPHAEAGFKTLKYRPDWPDRFNTIEEVAAMARLLASDQGSGITCAVLNVDGGTCAY